MVGWGGPWPCAGRQTGGADAPSAVVVGHTIPTVVGRSIYLDVNARLQAEAIALEGKVTYLDSEEARRWDAANGTYDRAWELWKRKAIVR
jgi:HCOMODA/2-hydroxy-3-carboxy-muconic semialdehyde decarboxylase